ncbi:MAG: Cof-type HAD-IIB family hydrolase [Bacteroidia bacterium]|nr:Cof-type HAD-IIB family hydrolase [Bacteroidia bacterium]
MYKLIALDIDGTLTNDEKVIPQRNIDALMKAQREYGMRIILASGRPTYGIQHLAEQLSLPRYGGFIMAYNGALLIDCSSDRILVQELLPRTTLPALCQAAKEFGQNLITYDEKNNTILTTVLGNKWIEHEAWLNNKMNLQLVENMHQQAPTELPKCLMVGEPEDMERLTPIMQERFPDLAIYRSSPFFMEIVPKGIDKAKTLSRLCRLTHTTPQESLIAMGDGFNDISMVDLAGFGVAMQNGCDDIKRVANFIAPSNVDCGVAVAMEKILTDSNI